MLKYLILTKNNLTCSCNVCGKKITQQEFDYNMGECNECFPDF